MDWSFLDTMDRNALYDYAEVLSKKKDRICFLQKPMEAESVFAERKMQYAYYYIWIVYRYVLNCSTIEETLPYQTKEILNAYKLNGFIKKIYIGAYNTDVEIRFRKWEDISIILEIVYQRYDMMEQLRCFIRHTSNLRKKRCQKALLICESLYRDAINGKENG